ncbi:hypothetical protein IQ231_04630 [Cuspidothrix issatschenkoi LEGE 03284]|uniref:hypothetical protein n=1 Tax=Cuspidothrix issatschenkoi TaxID=230752 RepID=UPI0019F5D7B9|nr:hypothetical protein [Cuspidothrix issatschenkoi]MBE9230989.1 hypothetical protein [Cuspidothrix issatschenkoi LEGE 03284]
MQVDLKILFADAFVGHLASKQNSRPPTYFGLATTVQHHIIIFYFWQVPRKNLSEGNWLNCSY